MPRRTWDATSPAMMGLEGLKGKPVAALCHAPQLRHAPYDPWRDQGLAPCRQRL